MAKGHENLIPLNKRTKEEQRKIQSMGGKASGVKRNVKKSFREAAKWGLEMETKFTHNGETEIISQYQRIVALLIQMINDPNDKRFFDAVRLLAQLRQSGYAEDKIIAEIKKIKAETKKLNGGTDSDIENLQPLAEMLKSEENEDNNNGENTDDTVETVLEET